MLHAFSKSLLTKNQRHAKLYYRARKVPAQYLFLLTCRQLVTSIFCHQYRLLFCPDLGMAVSAAVHLDTATSPGDLSPGTCLQINEHKLHLFPKKTFELSARRFFICICVILYFLAPNSYFILLYPLPLMSFRLPVL